MQKQLRNNVKKHNTDSFDSIYSKSFIIIIKTNQIIGFILRSNKDNDPLLISLDNGESNLCFYLSFKIYMNSIISRKVSYYAKQKTGYNIISILTKQAHDIFFNDIFGLIKKKF